MHVLELYDRDGNTGVGRAALTASSGLRSRGFKVTRLVGSTSLAEGDDVIVSKYCLDRSLSGLVRLAFIIRSVAVEREVTVVHAHQRRLALAATWGLIGTRVPVVEHVHSVFRDKAATSFRSDLILCLSAGLERDLVSRYPRVRGKTAICPNGVDLPALSDYVPGTRQELQLLGIGRVETAKSPIDFVGLIRDLRNKGVNVRGTWLGDGPILSQMRERHGVVVEWPGAVPDVLPYILSSDCVVSLSRREAVPFAVLDGMAAARPVMALGVGGLEDLVDHRVGICWSPSEAWENIVRDASVFLHYRQRLAEAGREARSRVAAGWSVDMAADCLAHQLREAVLRAEK